MADDLYVFHVEGWIRRGTSLINPSTLTASGTETVTAVADTTSRQMGAGTGKTLLQWSDFTYLGTYRLPDALQGYPAGHGYVSGLTHRWVGAEAYPRLYVAINNTGQLYEMRPTGEPGNEPDMTYLGELGVITVNALPGYIGYDAMRPTGLLWDETDQRLYFVQQARYASEGACTFGYRTLTAGTPSVLGAGSVFDFPPGHAYNTLFHSGLSIIPSTASTTYFAGKRLLLGWGQGASSPKDGQRSHGLGVCAIDTPDLARDTVPYNNGFIFTGGYQIGAQYPFISGNTNGRTNTISMTKPFPGANWRFYGENGIPLGSVYDLGNTDAIQGGIWIDTPTKHGILFSTVAAHSAFGQTGWTACAVEAPVGATTIQVTDAVDDVLVGDVLFFQSTWKRAQVQGFGNGVFGGGLTDAGVSAWGSLPPGETEDTLYGELVRVLAVNPATRTLTFQRKTGNADTIDDYPGAPGLHGIMRVGARILSGNAYFDAVVPVSRATYFITGVDPQHVCEAAIGARPVNAVPAAWTQTSPFPGYPISAFAPNIDESAGHVSDFTFDSRTNRLYALRHFIADRPSDQPTRLFVWQVSA